MFEAIGRLAFRRRRIVLALAVAFLAFAGSWGTGVFGALGGGGFEDPNSESAKAVEAVTAELGRQGADVVVLYSSDTLTVADPAFEKAVTSTLAALPKSDVLKTVTFYDTTSPTFVSADKHSTFAVVQLAGADDEAREETFAELRPKFQAPGLTTKLGGPVAVGDDISSQVGADIGRAEALSGPILMVLLVILFGSLVAASLPLVIGTLAVLGSFTALRAITLVTDVSVFSVNVVTLLGLGLAIDYALFMVSRFREELANGLDVESAIVKTMKTAGRTVAFSGVIVAISLSGLLLFPQVFLRSMGYGGIAAVLVAMISSLTVLPALFAVLGTRVNALRIPKLWGRRRAAAAETSDNGAWARIAHSVMRRPVMYLVVIVVALLTLASPFLRVSFGGVDTRVLPAATESRQVTESVAKFPGGGVEAIDVLVKGASAAETASLMTSIRAVSGVTDARSGTSRGEASLIEVRHGKPSTSVEARKIVEDVRALPAPAGAEVLVGGNTAELVDLLDSLGSRLPWMALLVALVTFVLLFVAFGSVVLPLKAIAMNVLSLGAAFGVVVWIFQDGHFADLLGFTVTGTIEATQPILMLAIIFGLSMDYEVFLLSRIRERWLATGDNTVAVATGLQQTGRIITSAGLLLMVVIGAFATSGITFIKLIGVGMVVAILVDATVVRALLVPATMRLLGSANWWAPGPLRRFSRPDLHGEGEVAPPVLEGVGSR